MKQTAFFPGDRVVVPPYGLGVVSGTCERTLGEQQATYYLIDFASSASRAYVPVAAPDHAGMRAALTGRDMPTLQEALLGSLDLPRQWAARQRRVAEILAAANPFELATLAGELGRWNAERGLPDLDRQALRRAIRLLEQELAGLDDPGAQEVQAFLHSAWNEEGQAR